MKKKIKKYTSQFRKEAVKLALQTEQPKAVIANELGINMSTYIYLDKKRNARKSRFTKK